MMWILTQQSNAKTLRGHTSCLLPGNQVEFLGRGTAGRVVLQTLSSPAQPRLRTLACEKVARKTGTTQEQRWSLSLKTEAEHSSSKRLGDANAGCRRCQTNRSASSRVKRREKKNPTTTRKRETTVIRHSLCFLRSGGDGKRGGEEK